VHVVCAGCKAKPTRGVSYVQCMGECKLYWHMKCAKVLDENFVLQASLVAKLWTCEKCDDLPPENNNAEQTAPRADGKFEAMEQRLATLESTVSSIIGEQSSPGAVGTSQVPRVAKSVPQGSKVLFSKVAAANCAGNAASPSVERLDITASAAASASAEEDEWLVVAARQNRPRKQPRDTTNDIFVQAAKPEEKEKTRKIVTEALSQKMRRDHVLDVFTTKSGVVVRCRDEAGKHAVSASFNEKEAERLRQPPPRAPPRTRVAVLGAYVDDLPHAENIQAGPNKEFVLAEAQANNLPNNSGISVLAIFKTKPYGRRQNSHRDEMVKIILAVDDENKSYLMNNNLQIGVKSCSVVEHCHLVVCYNCRGYGHISKDCNKEAPVCIKCAGDHISTTCEATGDDIRCVNCANFNKKGHETKMDEKHMATSRDCESYKRAKIACLKKRESA
jgi:Zinc knuckle